MDNTSTNSIFSKETNNDSQTPVLPRFAWNSQLAHLRVLFKVKKALERIEKEAMVLKS